MAQLTPKQLADIIFQTDDRITKNLDVSRFQTPNNTQEPLGSGFKLATESGAITAQYPQWVKDAQDCFDELNEEHYGKLPFSEVEDENSLLQAIRELLVLGMNENVVGQHIQFVMDNVPKIYEAIHLQVVAHHSSLPEIEALPKQPIYFKNLRLSLKQHIGTKNISNNPDGFNELWHNTVTQNAHAGYINALTGIIIQRGPGEQNGLFTVNPPAEWDGEELHP